jgi:hypothetical protein
MSTIKSKHFKQTLLLFSAASMLLGLHTGMSPLISGLSGSWWLMRDVYGMFCQASGCHYHFAIDQYIDEARCHLVETCLHELEGSERSAVTIEMLFSFDRVITCASKLAEAR